MRAAIVMAIAACAPVPAVAPSSPPPLPPRSLPITAAVIPALARPVIRDLPTTADGAMLVTAGSLRAEVSTREVRFAEAWFAEPIVSATKLSSGWVFVTADGVVARAEHFLDAPTLLGNVPPPGDHEITRSCGRVVVVTADGKLLTTTGSEAVAELSPGPRRVTHAAFVDPDHGMIIVDTGELLGTRDAGQSFRKIDLHVASVLGVECVGDRYRVTTSTGKVDLDKAAVQLAPGPAATLPYAPGLDTRIAIAVLRRYPRVVAEQFGGMIADDGRVLVPSRDQLRPAAEVTEVELGPKRCASGRWGEGFGIACGNGFYSVDGKTLASRHLFSTDFDPHVVFSSDGLHLGWHCGLSQFSRHHKATWCTGNRGGPIAEIFDDFVHVLGMRGDALIAAGDGKVFAVTTANAQQRVLLGALPDRVHADDLTLSGDGIVVAGASDPTRQLVGLTLATGVSYSRPLPAGATRAAMATASVGIAVGRDRSKVWATRDAGATWEQVPVAVEGALVDLHDGRRKHDSDEPIGEIHCTTMRCVIDGRVVIAFDGEALGAPSRVVAAPDRHPDAPRGSTLVDVQCEPVGKAKRTSGGEDLEEHIFDNGRVHFRRANATVSVFAGGSRFEAKWSGIDSLGEYTATTGTPPPAPKRVPFDAHLLAATRNGIVLSLAGSSLSELMWISPVAQARTRSIGRVDDVLVLPDQIAVLTETGDVAVIDKAGKVARSQIVADPTRNIGLAYFDGVIGVQSENRFYPVSSAPARDLPADDIAKLNICVDAGPVTTIRSYREDIVGSYDHQPKLRRAYLQAGCIQAIELSNHADGNQIFVAAVDGQLRTEAYHANIDSASTQQLRCGHRP